MQKTLSGRCALVTGGSRGIGKAISLGLAEAGANIVLTYRDNFDAAKQTIAAIQNIGVRVYALQMEVRDRNSVRKVMQEINSLFDGLDILVNNAGINKPTDFDQITDDDWDKIIAVNLKGPFVCTQEAFPLFKQKGRGSIINISSVSGQYGGPRTAHYAASKAGLISLGQVIARFGANFDISCNTVAAGLIDSEMAATSMQAGAVSKVAENILLRRLGSPKEVAEVVVFLASDSSAYITAQTINVNGGLYF